MSEPLSHLYGVMPHTTGFICELEVHPANNKTNAAVKNKNIIFDFIPSPPVFWKLDSKLTDD